MYIPVATDRTLIALQEWIETVAALPERHDLDAWMEAAEKAACDAGDGDIVIEMRGLATACGHPVTINLERDLFDWLPI
jgi:hypothetical protein